MKHFNLQIKIQQVEDVSEEAVINGRRERQNKIRTRDLLDFKTQLPRLSQIKAMAKASVDMVPDEEASSGTA